MTADEACRSKVNGAAASSTQGKEREKGGGDGFAKAQGINWVMSGSYRLDNGYWQLSHNTSTWAPHVQCRLMAGNPGSNTAIACRMFIQLLRLPFASYTYAMRIYRLGQSTRQFTVMLLAIESFIRAPSSHSSVIVMQISQAISLCQVHSLL